MENTTQDHIPSRFGKFNSFKTANCLTYLVVVLVKKLHKLIILHGDEVAELEDSCGSLFNKWEKITTKLISL